MLESIESSQLVIEAVLHHHERFDGQGYPDGLRGDEIPLMARALAIVDAYCAMTEDRPYRAALGSEEALRELEAGAGSLYDPLVVEALQAALAD
jgi:HD-GYP domain-containing protein (c-di-GMP phosphodiesterase class II)